MAYPDLMEEKQQLGPRIPDAQQAVKPIVPLSGDFFNNQLNQELGNVSPPPHSYQDFLKQNNGIAPVTFGNKDGMAAALESQYFDAEHNWKKETGANMGRGGGGGFDPQAAYQAAVLNNRAYNPNLAYVTTQWLREQMAKDPATAAQMAEQKAQEEFATSRKYTPAMQEVRSRLSQEGQAQFDAGRDGEILQKLFPEQFAKAHSQIERGTDTLSNTGDRRDAALKSQAIDIISARLEAGLINEVQAAEALRTISSTNRLQYRTTNTTDGSILAAALGLPNDTGGGIYRGQRVDGERYRISEGFDLSGRTAIEARDKRRAADSAEGRAASDQKMQEQEFNDKQAAKLADANWKPGATKEITLSDRRKQQLIEIARDTWQQATGKADVADKRPAGKLYENPVGWEYKGMDGKITVYDRDGWNLGSDGKLYGLRLKATAAPGSKDPRDLEWAFPQGVTAQENPPVEGAKKAPDGKWYVEKEGKFYKVGK